MTEKLETIFSPLIIRNLVIPQAAIREIAPPKDGYPDQDRMAIVLNLIKRKHYFLAHTSPSGNYVYMVIALPIRITLIDSETEQAFASFDLTGRGEFEVALGGGGRTSESENGNGGALAEQENLDTILRYMKVNGSSIVYSHLRSEILLLAANGGLPQAIIPSLDSNVLVDVLEELAGQWEEPDEQEY